jgi:NTP pyrophosphatase (non-canonical NTP hydrolase)
MNSQQKQVDEWVGQYKDGYWSPHEILARLTEEVGELAREVNYRFGPKKKKATEDTADIEEEIGDIIFTVACMSNKLGLDMDRAFQKAMDKCYGRDKDRFEKK